MNLWMRCLHQTPAVAASLLVHVALLGAFAAIKFQMLAEKKLRVDIWTVIDEKREQEQFTQKLTVDKTVSNAVDLVSGGMKSTSVSASTSPAIQSRRIHQSNSLHDPKVLNVSTIDMPSPHLLGESVGVGELMGDIGARTAGYGSALSRISAELMREMREQPVLAVWLFDASGSLADDREEINAEFHRVYEELNIVKEQAEVRKQKFEALETMVCMFGENVTPLMREPSGDLKKIRTAIEAISQDEAGQENVFSAIIAVLDQYAEACLRVDRKLMIIVVSDESGDDGEHLETAVARAKQGRAPVYFLGRESIFGYPYASVRIRDEETGIFVWPTISRGPETAMPEAIQWTGFTKRHGRNAENSSAGFGPYEQVRLARESGGIFFLLADAEETLAGGNTQREYDQLAMKEYRPLLLPRKQYVQERVASPFRESIWQIISRLNPNTDEQLNFGWRFYAERSAFTQRAKSEFAKSKRAIGLLNSAIDELERLRPDRALEASARWRAAYDLLYAQCLTYKVRLFQYALALDHRMTVWPTLKDEKTNRLDRYFTRELRQPDERQVAVTGVTLEEMEQAQQTAVGAFESVVSNHPGTPWAVRADIEKRRGFGTRFREVFYNPTPPPPGEKPKRPKVPKL